MIRFMVAAALLSLPELGSVSEAAVAFRCGPKAVYSGVAAGTIPHIRLGERTIRIPIRAIVEAANQQAATSNAPSTHTGDAEDDSLNRVSRHGR